MTKQRLGLSGLNLGLLVGLLSVVLGACTRVEDDSSGSGATNGTGTQQTGRGGGQATSNTGTGLTGTTTPSNTSRGGASSTTAPTGTGNVTSCPGLPATPDPTSTDPPCNGATVEAEPLPVDMIILMDRSISNSYAVGSDSAEPATGGQLSRWDVLTAAMSALASAPKAATLGASITFFSIDGGSGETPNCDETKYTTPVVPLGLLGTTGPLIVDAMKALKPSGLTPTVPALTGAFKYAMAEKQKDPTREKVVVMISDGFPTQCSLRSPSDVDNVIKAAATAPIPIRTFIIGIGSPNTMSSGKFNLQNYARSGNTGKPPFVLDETKGADGVQQDLVSALLNISNSPLACDYDLAPPSNDWEINPDEVKFTYQPSSGDLQEVPKVSSAASCAKAPNGGWYFDDPSDPKKITVCPCSCANFGAGTATLVYGCKPKLVIE
jgi:hypothetical protein